MSHEIDKLAGAEAVTYVEGNTCGSLVVMLAMSGYENFISTHSAGEQRRQRSTFFSRLDQGTIKIKLAMTIIAISSIRMLQMYMEIEK